MGLQRGERQAQRTKKALTEAFLALLHDHKEYSDITVNDITERANLGRATFYRHFPSKADVLVHLHEGIFNRFSLGLSSADAWLAEEPPPQLPTFLQQYQQSSNLPTDMSHRLGKDFDYLLRNINEMMARQFEESLHHSFAETASNIPFRLLAQSIAGTYNRLILTWFTGEQQTLSADQIAGYIHRLARAAVHEALDY